MATTARRNSSEGISHYLRSLGGHKQLTREQEYSLSKRARKGDEEARRILAVSNLPFVVAVGVNVWGTIGGSTDAERAALYAVEDTDPSAGVTVSCSQRWVRPAAFVGRVTYECTHLTCASGPLQEIGRSTISHTILDGWRYVLHGHLRGHAVADSGPTQPFNQTDTC